MSTSDAGRPLRIGLIGTGFMGETHLNAWQTIDGAEIAAVASLESDSAEEVAAAAAADAVVGPDAAAEVIGRADIDAVDLTVPTDLHHRLTLAALDGGKHVFCEKPFTRTLAEAQEVIDRADETGVTLMVGHVVRFFPQYRQARDMLAAGELGQPKLARFARLSVYPDHGYDDWFADEERSGGVLLDLAIHDFDFVQWALGPVERVYSQSTAVGGARHQDDGREYALTTLRLASGPLVHVEASWAEPAGAPFTTRFEIRGSGGQVEYDSGASTPLVVRTAGQEDAASPLHPEEDPYRLELAAFVDAVRTGSEPPVPAREALAAMAVSIAARESARTGRPVPVSEVMPA